MKFFHNHIIVNALSIALVLFLFTPSIVKLKHAISEHEHFECTAVGEIHIHKIELDCDFEKFNLSPQFEPRLIQLPENFNTSEYKVASQLYTFLSYYQKMHFTLRGPPSLVS